MLGALQSNELTAIIIQSVVVSYAFELCVRNILLFRNKKLLHIHIGKSLLGFFFAVKTSFFLSFYTNQGPSCYVSAYLADIFYQLGMVAGNYVLLSRAHAIVPLPWKTVSKYSMLVFLVLRFIIGVVDTVFLKLGYDEYGMCTYTDNFYTGPIYTFFDLIIDVYVSVVITWVLVTHIRRLEKAHLPVNVSLYFAVVTHNIIRTVTLTVVNLISGIFLIMGMSNQFIMIVWPVINLFVVLLIGYDSDVTKTIIELKEQYWSKVNSLISSTTLGTPLVMKESLSVNSRNQPMWKSSPDLPLRDLTHMHRVYTSSSAQKRHQQQQDDYHQQLYRYPRNGYWTDEERSL
ncbi:hypothetical protein BCR42DRAFT_407629 [Absidia repens]|uniref:Uncharacterized protein n=1 Tax=Absidia repens TaxID=90262 RepID=A0A1X2ISG5_9FUNG|nr:hypothetical protein BCR42DRAFT_407629 [Absidia repens]